MFKPLSGAIALAVLVAAPWQHVIASSDVNAVVSATAPAAPNTFKTIGEAIASAPADTTPFVIYIKKGTYHERMVITRPNVHFKGEDRDHTIIAVDTAAGALKPDGSKWGTSGSYTVKIDAPDFSARTLTIRNDFDYLGNEAKKSDDPTKIKDTQAVALLVAEKSDRAYFHDVRLVGYQDTLYVKGGRSFFEKCRISGTVGFIFGNGTALFDDCNIVARTRVNPGDESYGYLTAPRTDINQKYGLVITNSRVFKEGSHVPAKSYALGSPWHPTTTFPDGRYADPNAIGQTVFINTEMDDVIYGQDKMSGKDIKGEKIWFQPQDSRILEYHSTGAGAEKNDGRRQLTAEQAAEYTKDKVLAGWTPTAPLQDIPRSSLGEERG